MARKVLEVTDITQVNEDGEIKSRESKTKYRPDGEPEYVKLYLNTVLYLKSLPKGYNPILLAFLKRMSYATTGQKVYVNAEMKREIAAETKVSLNYINHAITDFVKGKLMFRTGTGTYQFNPQFFGRGDWADIEAIKATITFNPEGTDFATELVKVDKIAANKEIARQEPTEAELESAGQTTILEAIEQQSATKAPEAPEPPKDPKKYCRDCGTELVLTPKRDGTSFMGCPKWREHKKRGA